MTPIDEPPRIEAPSIRGPRSLKRHLGLKNTVRRKAPRMTRITQIRSKPLRCLCCITIINNNKPNPFNDNMLDTSPAEPCFRAFYKNHKPIT